MAEQREAEVTALRELVAEFDNTGYRCPLYEHRTSNYAVLFVVPLEASGVDRGPIGWMIHLTQTGVALNRLGDRTAIAAEANVASIMMAIRAAEADLSKLVWPQHPERHVVEVQPFPL